MSTLGAALDAAAAKAYGDGYEDLPLQAKYAVREHMLPVFNAILPHLRDGIAAMVDERAESQELFGQVQAGVQLRRAANDIRRWPS